MDSFDSKIEQSSYLLDLLKDNPYLTLISIILAILGIFFTAYFYYLSKKNKKPIYAIRTINLVKESIKKINAIDIYHSNKKIQNFSISKIAFWNDGKETINVQDIAKKDPLQIEIASEYEILEAKLIYQKNVANDFSFKLSDDKKNIQLSFDFIDFEEGIILEIFHTANSSDDFTLKGTFKSVKGIQKKQLKRFPVLSKIFETIGFNRSLIRKISLYILVIIGAFFSIAQFFIEAPEKVEPRTLGEKILFSFLWLPYIWLPYKLLKRRIPKGFDIFNDEF